MDPTAFDFLTQAIARRETRRWLVRLVATLPLVGVLAVEAAEERAAERPIDRVQDRTLQRSRKQGNKNNRKKQRKNKKSKKHRQREDSRGGPFGTSCVRSVDCASGICACLTQDCSGRGLCADAPGPECGAGKAQVNTADGGGFVCAGDGSGSCGCGRVCANPMQPCALNPFGRCVVLVPH
jgi:hypothetical protein